MTKFKWKKGFLSQTISVFKNSDLIGELSENSFSDLTKLRMKSENSKYEIVKQGAFSSVFLIKNSTTNERIGEISYDSLQTRAKIKLKGENYDWKQKGFFKSSWTLSSNEGLISTYTRNFSGGEISTNQEDLLLNLVGLFTTNYYLRYIFMTLFIVMIVLIISNK